MNTIGRVTSEQVVRTVGRYTCRELVVIIDGQERPAFAKTPNNEATAPYGVQAGLMAPLVTEAGKTAMVQSSGGPVPLFRGPDVYGNIYEGNAPVTTVYEWLNGEDLTDSNPVETARILARIAAALANYHPPIFDQSYRPSWSLRESYPEHMARFRNELDKFIEAEVISKDLVERGLWLINRLYPTLQGTFCHGDLTAKHVYPDKAQLPRALFVAIDTEYARIWPPHYDAANMFARYAITHPHADAAAAAFDQYVVSVDGDSEDLLPALKASLMVRSLAIVKGMGLPLTAGRAELRDRAVRMAEGLFGVHTMAELRQLVTSQETAH